MREKILLELFGKEANILDKRFLMRSWITRRRKTFICPASRRLPQDSTKLSLGEIGSCIFSMRGTDREIILVIDIYTNRDFVSAAVV